MNSAQNTPDTDQQPTDQQPANHTEHPRRIRSYVLRAGRTTEGQARAFRELSSQYIVAYQPANIDWSGHFQRKAAHVLEIGFGMGEATAHIASIQPETDFIACEVHPPGVGKLMLRLKEQGLSNVRIVQHDAVEVLEHMIAPQSLDGVHIFFPDPWHKKRHNKRRLIQPPLTALLASRLRPGGYIHCATDWEPYATQILQVLGTTQGLVNSAQTSNGYAPKPEYRPLTKFELRGKRLGHGVWDIVFTKTD